MTNFANFSSSERAPFEIAQVGTMCRLSSLPPDLLVASTTTPTWILEVPRNHKAWRIRPLLEARLKVHLFPQLKFVPVVNYKKLNLRTPRPAFSFRGSSCHGRYLKLLTGESRGVLLLLLKSLS